jgi:hypothetical protein
MFRKFIKKCLGGGRAEARQGYACACMQLGLSNEPSLSELSYLGLRSLQITRAQLKPSLVALRV